MNTLLLLEAESGKIQPLGWVLIIGFIIIVTICIYVDKTASKRFVSKINKEYPAKSTVGDMRITDKGEIIYYLQSGTLAGYKKWNINDISYIALGRSSFSLLDNNKKALAGQYLTPSKKPLKENSYKSFACTNPEQYAQFLINAKSSIEQVEE